MMIVALLLAQSAFACTFQSALAGERCVYEAAQAKGDARENSRAAAEAALKACPASTRAECEKAVAEISLGPKCAVSFRLADADGHLVPEAAGCVEELRRAISHASKAAAVSPACCTCLSAARCAVPIAQCRSEVGELNPGAALRGCMAKSCAEECAFVAPAKPVEKAVENKSESDKI